MTIRVVVGPPCAGKSTHILEHAVEGDVTVDFDRMAQALGSAGPHDVPSAIIRATLAARSGVVGLALSTWADLDGDVWFPYSLPPKGLLDRFAEEGAEFIVVDPGIDVCLARAEEDGRPEGTADVIRQWYDNPPEIPGGNGQKGTNVITSTIDRPVEIKAGPDDGLAEGEFTAYASIYDNVDSYGDIVAKGAFRVTLADWEASGAPIPLYWGHNIADPDFNIGEIVEAVEDDRGLLVKARLDLDNPKSAQTYRLLKGRRVREMSFGFATVKASDDERDGRPVRRLDEVKLFEVSVVPVGANPDTAVMAVRAATSSLAMQAKSGRGFSAKSDETVRTVIADLRDAADSLESMLPPSDEEDEETPDDSGDTDDQDKASTDGSVAGKPAASSEVSVDPWAAKIQILNMRGVSR